MSEHIDTELILAAWGMALTQRQPPAGLVFHSDRGVQYASHDYRHALHSAQAIASMSRKGNCYDNAAMESFWSTLKYELIYRRHFKTRCEARQAIFDFIEVFYNRRRLHSSRAGDKIPQTEFFAFFCCFGIWHAHILLAMNPKPTPQSLLNDIAQIQRLDRGTVSVLRQGPQGPYYNHQCYEKGRNVSRYVPAEQVPDLQAAIDGYRRVQELMAQYVQLLVEQTRAERAAGAKKKTQRPNFSWPKSRKSNS